MNNVIVPPDSCLLKEEYIIMASTARDLLGTRKRNYTGVNFERDVSDASGVPSSQIASVLVAPNEHVGHILTGLEWERLFSSARIYPEDFVAASGLRRSLGMVVPEPESAYAASHHDAPPPSAATDKRVRALLDVMSDFFFMATLNVGETKGHLDATPA